MGSIVWSPDKLESLRTNVSYYCLDYSRARIIATEDGKLKVTIDKPLFLMREDSMYPYNTPQVVFCRGEVGAECEMLYNLLTMERAERILARWCTRECRGWDNLKIQRTPLTMAEIKEYKGATQHGDRRARLLKEIEAASIVAKDRERSASGAAALHDRYSILAAPSVASTPEPEKPAVSQAVRVPAAKPSTRRRTEGGVK